MAYDNPPFPVRRGDDRLIEIDVVDDDDVAVDLEADGIKVRLSYGKSVSHALKVLTESDLKLENNRVTYRMPPTESLALEAYRTYWIQCRVSLPDGSADGFRDTVATGSFTVDQTQG